MDEPSVFDYVKSKLLFWKNIQIDLPSEIQEDEAAHQLDAIVNREGDFSFPVSDDDVKTTIDSDIEQESKKKFPWRVLLAVMLAIFAQSFLEPPDPSPTIAIAVYTIAAITWLWGIIVGEIGQIQENSVEDALSSEEEVSMFIRIESFLLSLVFMLLAFIAFGGNRFTWLNLLIWSGAIISVLVALWSTSTTIRMKFQRVSGFLRRPKFSVLFTPWTFLMILVLGITFYFRFHMLEQVPGEMFSDHAEKLLDVADVLSGKTSIFFERNTGREAIQMYLTAAISILCNTGLSFMSLKIGTALAGFLTLPFIYLLGKELENRWVGIIALLLAGIAYWPNVISRIGLRFPLYPLFVAPTLYFLIRGLRKSNRNDFILSGISLGLGLHGYSPFRVVTIVVVFVVLLYALHEKSYNRKKQAVVAISILAFISLIIFLPLLRYMIERPDMFNYRAMSRLTQSERAFDSPLLIIFLKNLWNASIMFFWKNGSIWVHSVTDRPALDVVTAAFFFLGILLVVFRYARNKKWEDAFLILSIPLLMMPSILSLAFPDENPSLNRTGGAIIPVFIVAAIAFEATFRHMFKSMKSSKGKSFAVLLAVFLVLVSMRQNYDLVFNQFKEQFYRGAWNTTDLGHVIQGYANSIGDRDTAYVVPYPHWVDTRLVGINAGYPEKDYALSRELIPDTLADTRSKLFLVKPEDVDIMAELMEIYPQGSLTVKGSQYEGKDFYLYLVPPTDSMKELEK